MHRLIPSLLVLLVQAGPLAAQPENVFSHAAGARVVAFSSEYGGGWDAASLVAGASGPDAELPVWCSASDAPFPHWLVVELPRVTWLTTLVFNNALPDEGAYPGISAKDVQVLVSSESATAGFRPVTGFRLERNRNHQEVRIDPVQARWVRIVVTSNWGNPTWTELGQLGGYDDGSRTGDVAAELRARRPIDLYGIYFDFGAATLREESGPVLDQVAGVLREEPALRLTVEGHTDAVGAAAANQRLSEQRAAAVVAALVSRGVPAERLTARGLGAARPVVENSSPVGRAKNRRVTLRAE